MPIANEIEFEKTSREQLQPDLHLLLRDIRASNAGNLNSLYGRGMPLFAEGEPGRGIYILRTGRALVSITSSEGRVVILRSARSGDVLGLNAVLRGSAYEMTVKALEPCRTDFIPRAGVLDLLENPAGARAVMTILSRELTDLTERARLLLLPQTASARLAKLLLEWSRENGFHASSASRIDRVFTHEEIAQMICSSRETVTRLFASLSRRKIIQIDPESIVIRDGTALENMMVG